MLHQPHAHDRRGPASQRLPPRRIGFGAPLGAAFDYTAGDQRRQPPPPTQGIASGYTSTHRQGERQAGRSSDGFGGDGFGSDGFGAGFGSESTTEPSAGAAPKLLGGADAATPVAMTEPYVAAVRARVRWTLVLTLLTAASLMAADWYWLLVVRPASLASDSSLSQVRALPLLPLPWPALLTLPWPPVRWRPLLTLPWPPLLILPCLESLSQGGDGALLLLGVAWAAPLTSAHYAGWGAMSCVSSVALAAAYWVSLCCVACVLEAHVQVRGLPSPSLGLFSSSLCLPSSVDSFWLLLVPDHSY